MDESAFHIGMDRDGFRVTRIAELVSVKDFWTHSAALGGLFASVSASPIVSDDVRMVEENKSSLTSLSKRARKYCGCEVRAFMASIAQGDVHGRPASGAQRRRHVGSRKGGEPQLMSLHFELKSQAAIR